VSSIERGGVDVIINMTMAQFTAFFERRNRWAEINSSLLRLALTRFAAICLSVAMQRTPNPRLRSLDRPNQMRHRKRNRILNSSEDFERS
jgi:hypothetical protein